MPTSTRGKRSSESLMSMRMQPWEALVPMEPLLDVPWMKTPEVLVPMARVPSGLPGPGGM